MIQSSDEFSFIVCIIDKAAEYYPFGYTHTNKSGSLFVPTMHYHTHTYIRRPGADWDHTIYTLGDVINRDKASEIPKFTNSTLQKCKWDTLKRKEIYGNHPNTDLQFPAVY